MEIFDGCGTNDAKSQQHSCECGRSFKKASQLDYHIRRVHFAEKNFACSSCDKAFFKKSDLDNHLLTHGNSFKCVCKFCGRSFKHISNMNRHIRTHTGVKPYPCSVCTKRFCQVSALQQHMQTEHHRAKLAELNKMASAISIPPIPDLSFIDPDDPDEDGRVLESLINTSEMDQSSSASRKWWFYCGICDQRFQFIEQLRQHEYHHVLKKELICELCNLTFDSIATLKSHGCGKSKTETNVTTPIPVASLQSSMLDEAPLTGLDMTGGNSSEENILTNNVQLSLTGNGQILLDNNEVLLIISDKIYGAVLVNSDVTVVENDAMHRVLNGITLPDKSATSNVEKVMPSNSMGDSYPCDSPPVLDDAQYAEMEDKEKLLLLQLWMMDQKNGIAPEEKCTEEEDSEMKSLEAPAEPAKPKPMFQCKECGKIFNKRHNYQQHLGTHFSSEQRYECPICNQHFAWKSTVGKHIAKVHGERSEYECDQCGKIYNSSLVLQHHIQRDHLNIRQHKCSKCEKSYFRKCDLQLHFRKHSDEKPYVCEVCGKRFRHSSNHLRHRRQHLKQLTESSSSLDRLQENESVITGF